MTKTSVALLISGRGSNATALIEACKAENFPAQVCIVISNNPEAPGLEVARQAGLRTRVVDHRPFGKNREAHEQALHACLTEAGAELICLAGYMRLLTPWLTSTWAGRMLNIHPSLLPSFPGLHTHERALEAGVRLHGCTVHIVTEGMDEGPVLGQAAVPVLPGDTADALAARVLKQEHRLYPTVVKHFLDKTAPACQGGEALLVG
ncbi:phosphoribosylglycinamide formyltransferase [Acetobacter thailandicus]|uniref:phosphoribosylglycinamide formyltransferase n=1 Tax=Acetobacter thailandicus TaxID=1502842 RepID=UPI001BAC568D|nr:phosphoribosylglycinamide formyltransferase [Acetobacter thailandicus]MBS1002457.1 phosphoribosylglycinamide formyltransferase [Acetobacter thailandicus]